MKERIPVPAGDAALLRGTAQPMFSVVAPVYDEEETLPAFYTRVVAVMEQLREPFEIVLVDDGSRDRSWEIVRELAARDTRVRGLASRATSGTRWRSQRVSLTRTRTRANYGDSERNRMHGRAGLKLSDYARKRGVRYATAWRWCKPGHRAGQPLPAGTLVRCAPEEMAAPQPPVAVAVSARVSAAADRPDRERQADRLSASRRAQGEQLAPVVKAVGAGGTDRQSPAIAPLVGSPRECRAGRRAQSSANALRLWLPPKPARTPGTHQGRRSAVVKRAEDGREN